MDKTRLRSKIVREFMQWSSHKNITRGEYYDNCDSYIDEFLESQWISVKDRESLRDKIMEILEGHQDHMTDGKETADELIKLFNTRTPKENV